MSLSKELLSQFAKTTKTEDTTPKAASLYGTVVTFQGEKYVKLDGSDRLTPVSTTSNNKAGDRVIVEIKNHSAVISGNVSSPSANTDDLKEIDNRLLEIHSIVADKATIAELDAQKARISSLEADNVTIKGDVSASRADIKEIQTNYLNVTERLNANSASITKLQAEKLDAATADITYATIENLEATNADIHNLEATYGEFKQLTAKNFEADRADIKDLYANKMNTVDAEIKFANIDFSNIGKAAIERFYATSGIIQNLVIGDQTVTGELVGVTIKGDLIEGNTIVADKLVIKGEDGLYYKLNTDGITTEAEQTDYNSLNGSIIQAKSVTAEKISVNDLVAFGATIAGFHITKDALYSGVKESAINTTRGIFMGKDGQFAFGDGNNYVKYYKDTDGTYKLKISAESMVFSAGSKDLEGILDGINDRMDSIEDEVTVSLYISSSRGNVFKNANVSTVLSVTLYKGTIRVTDSDTMHSVFGENTYLQWKYQKKDDDEFLLLPPEDERITDGGFKLTVSPNDIDTKGVYTCDLIVEEE